MQATIINFQYDKPGSGKFFVYYSKLISRKQHLAHYYSTTEENILNQDEVSSSIVKTVSWRSTLLSRLLCPHPRDNVCLGKIFEYRLLKSMFL